MLILRPVAPGDLDRLVELAESLDTVNLPRDPDFLRERIARSQGSFSGEIRDWRDGVYVFVLEDT